MQQVTVSLRCEVHALVVLRFFWVLLPGVSEAGGKGPQQLFTRRQIAGLYELRVSDRLVGLLDDFVVRFNRYHD